MRGSLAPPEPRAQTTDMLSENTFTVDFCHAVYTPYSHSYHHLLGGLAMTVATPPGISGLGC